ncbi:2-isopropylmalate synthase [Moritella sp. 24]|nr:2-isopropylmalate synthase [Moritella sp. 24]QUM75293.1 2-isopropylmalate synthase [Moritella sp. 24]
MLFKNENGEMVELADDLTLKELTEMGIDISLVENDCDEPLDSWSHLANH